MFDYNKYKEESEEIYNFKSKRRIIKISNNELNRKYKIIFSHYLSDAWGMPLEEFYLIDDEQNNVVRYNCETDKQYTYTVPYEDIKEYIDLLNDTSNIFKETEVIYPSVLDGMHHTIYLRSDEKNITLECSNLAYWMSHQPKIYEYEKNNYKEENVEYTKNIIKIFKKIQQILRKNNIRYKLLK